MSAEQGEAEGASAAKQDAPETRAFRRKKRGAIGEYEALCMYGLDDFAQYVPTDCWFMLLDRAGGVL